MLFLGAGPLLSKDASGSQPEQLMTSEPNLRRMDKEEARKITAEDYGRVAVLWDRYWVPAYSLARERLFDIARLKQGESVLDVGTGTGATAVVAAVTVGGKGSVLAVDNSKGMLAVAKRKARKLYLTNLKFKLAGLASLQLPDESFDAVISSYGMPDQASDTELALRRLFKAMRRDARLCFCERAGNPKEPDAIIKRLLRKYRVTEADSKLKTRRRLEALTASEGKRFHSLYHTEASTIRDVVETAGFTKVRAFREIFPVKFPKIQTYLDVEFPSSFRDEYAAMPHEFRRKFMGAVLRNLDRFKTKQGLAWRAGVNFCLARR